MIGRNRSHALFVVLAIGSVCRFSVGDDQANSNSPASETKSDFSKHERTARAESIQRTVYFAKDASARSLLYLLEKHFEGHAGIKFLAEPNSNMLSIRANTETALEEVLKLLTQIDRPLRQITLHVLIVEFNIKKADVADVSAMKPPVDIGELSGSAEAVVSKLRTWLTQGHVASVQKFQLNAIENSTAQLFLGETKPVPSAVSSNASTGIATPVLTTRELGTSIQATPIMTQRGEIEVALAISDSQLLPPELGTEMAKGEKGPIMSRASKMKHLRTSLTIADGQSGVATEWQVADKSNHLPSIVVVSARILTPDKPRAAVANEPTRAAVPLNAIDTPVLTNSPPENDNRPSRNAPAALEGFRRPSLRRASLFSAILDEAFAERIKLTNEQQTEIQKMRRDMRSASRNASSPEDRLKITQEFEEKAVNVLNDDQKKVWAERKTAAQIETNDSKKAAGPDSDPLAPSPQTERNNSDSETSQSGHPALPEKPSSRVASPFHGTFLFIQLRDEEFLKRLELTDEQLQKVTQLRREMIFAGKLTKMMNSVTRDEYLNVQEQRVNDILSDEQKKIWAEEKAVLTVPKDETHPKTPPAAKTPEADTAGKQPPTSLSNSVVSSSLAEEEVIPERIYVPLLDKTFIERLKLTDEQQKRFDQVVTTIKEAFRPASGKTQREMYRHVKQLEQEAYDQLTFEQKGLWNQRSAERQADLNKSVSEAVNASSPSRRRRRSDRPTTPDERLADINEQLASRPNSASHLVRRASILVELNKWDEAIADLQKANSEEPDSFTASIHLAAVLAYRSDEAGFRECTRHLLRNLSSQHATYAQGEIAEICLLMPDWLDDPEHVKTLFEKSLEAQQSIGVSRFGRPFAFESDRQLKRCQLDLLNHQPLLAINGLENLLSHLDETDRSSRDHAFKTRLSLAVAFNSIGDEVRARSLLREAEQIQGSTPITMESVANHVLLRQARLKMQ